MDDYREENMRHLLNSLSKMKDAEKFIVCPCSNLYSESLFNRFSGINNHKCCRRKFCATVGMGINLSPKFLGFFLARFDVCLKVSYA